MSSIVNKVKDALHSDKKHEAPEGTHGPHSSRVANAADPRVDSDRDHRANPATGTHTGEGAYARPHEGVGASTYGTEAPQGTHGPHSSRLANTADPRVDSDRDHRAAPGSTFGTTGTHSTHTGTSGLGSTGIYGSSGTSEGAHGPHSSRVANAVDPRVDSDRDHRAAPGSTFGSTGTHTGTHTGAGLGSTGTYGSSAEGAHGPHSSRVANAADPRVDSDRDHRGTAATTHVGPAQNTAVSLQYTILTFERKKIHLLTNILGPSQE